MPLQFVKSNKGHNLLVVDGFTFRKETIIKTKTFWRCTEFDRRKCRARCHTQDDNIIKISAHSHGPDAAKIETRKAMHLIRERASATKEPGHQLVAAFSRRVGAAAARQRPPVRPKQSTSPSASIVVGMPLEFVKSNKGRNLLVVDGFTFRKETMIKTKTFWRCTEFERRKCRARCHTQDGNIVKITAHSHVPDAAKIETRKAMHLIKERACATQEPGHEIVATFSRSVGAAVAGQLPPVSHIKQTIRRIRRRLGTPLPTSSNLQDLEPPHKFMKMTAGNDFFCTTVDRISITL